MPENGVYLKFLVVKRRIRHFSRKSRGGDVSLFVVQASDAGQHLALEEFKGCAAAGGDVRHLVRISQLRHSRRAVAAADDGDRVGLGKRLRDRLGALGEVFHLEDAHGSVPHHGLCRLHRIREEGDGLGTDVQPHPAVGDVALDHLDVGVVGEGVRDDVVHGEHELGCMPCRRR